MDASGDLGDAKMNDKSENAGEGRSLEKNSGCGVLSAGEREEEEDIVPQETADG